MTHAHADVPICSVFGCVRYYSVSAVLSGVRPIVARQGRILFEAVTSERATFWARTGRRNHSWWIGPDSEGVLLASDSEPVDNVDGESRPGREDYHHERFTVGVDIGPGEKDRRSSTMMGRSSFLHCYGSRTIGG